jgi:hypothetical protein
LRKRLAQAEKLLRELRRAMQRAFESASRKDLLVDIERAALLARESNWGRPVDAPAARPIILPTHERMTAMIRRRAQLGGAAALCATARARGVALEAELQERLHEVDVYNRCLALGPGATSQTPADAALAAMLKQCGLLRGQITTAENVVAHSAAAQAVEEAAARAAIWTMVSRRVEPRRARRRRLRVKQAGLERDERLARRAHREAFTTVMAELQRLIPLAWLEVAPPRVAAEEEDTEDEPWWEGLSGSGLVSRWTCPPRATGGMGDMVPAEWEARQRWMEERH